MKLYRGENIQNGKAERVDFLKRHLRYGLPADFLNGGNPYRVQQLGLFDATVRHVARNNLGIGPNGLKHFFSFSQEKATASDYALAYWDKDGQKRANSYEVFDAYYTIDLNSYRDDQIWPYTQHLIIELDITSGQPVHPSSPFLKIVSCNGGNNRLVALDVVAYLQFQIARIGQPSDELLRQFPNVLPELQTALGYATTDTEWLIASLDPIPPQPNMRTSFSAIIPHSEILQVQHHVDADYFSNRY